MADNPWAGIGNIGAIDQKLYQTPKKELAVPSPAENNPEEKPVTKRQIKAKKEAVEEKPAIVEQEIPSWWVNSANRTIISKIYMFPSIYQRG